ncbi:calcium ion binding, calmodulin [Xylogone sp. PMI_703]|nr:calcium ion binding, calmodulin [Xylogone sp. PMI_703]
MAESLSKEQIETFRDAFTLFDKDGNGKISAKELGSVMRSLGQAPTETELQDLISGVDTDRDGEVDFEEFVTMMAYKSEKPDFDKEMRQAFRVFDRDNSGTISSEELRRVLASLGENLTDEQIDELMKEADQDGDGKIDYYEFSQIMTK